MVSRELIDQFGRRIRYLRLSVTDRCDLRCSYCIPERFSDFSEPASWLTFQEIVRLVNLFAEFGVSHVRLTGGEPLTRKNLPDLVREIAQIDGVADISLSTNGTQLARQAEALRVAGVKRLNVSLDTLNPERFRQITGSNDIKSVLDGLAAAKRIGFEPIKINMVVMPGVNETDVDEVVSYAIANNFVLRLIETMPMGASGQRFEALKLDSIRNRLVNRFALKPAKADGAGPAEYLENEAGDFRVGFITPISQHFCATCNRVRLTADGVLYLCLGQEDKLDLRSAMRSGAGNDELALMISDAVLRKPERHEFSNKAKKVVRIMAATGG